MTRWMLVLCLGTLTGCGDQERPDDYADNTAGAGGGSGSAGSGHTDNGADPQALYPLVDGAQWVYAHRGGNTDWDEEVHLEAVEHEGSPAFLLVDTAGPSGSRSESILRQLDSVVHRVRKDVYTGNQLDSSVHYDPGFARFDSAWLDQDVGYTELLTYSRIEYDRSGAVLRDGQRAHSFTIEAVDESVSTPAGTFEGCMRVFRMRSRDAVGSEMDDDDKRYWYCPNVGKVREEEPNTGKYEELLSCDLPGSPCR